MTARTPAAPQPGQEPWKGGSGGSRVRRGAMESVRIPVGDALGDALMRSGRCCSAPDPPPGRHADAPRRGSAPGPGAPGATCRRGARRSRSCAEPGRRCARSWFRRHWKTASNEAVKVGPRSRIRNRKSSDRSPGFRARLRACCAVHAPVGCAVTPPRCIWRVPCSINTSTYSRASRTVSTCMQEVHAQNPGGLGVQELPPRRA